MTQASKPEAGNRDRFEPAGEHGPIKPFDFDPNRYVFISYLNETDPDLLRAIVRSFLRRGVSVWMYDPVPCRLTEEEGRAVRSQEEDQQERRGVHWQTLVTDAIARSSCVLLLIGKRSHEHQKLEIEHAIAKGHYHAVRIDDIPDGQVPEKLREGLNRRLDVRHQAPDVIAAAIERLADRLAKDVLGDAFRPVPKRIKAKSIVSDGRLGLVAAVALLVALGAAAAVLWPRPEPPPEVVAYDPSAVPVTGPRLALVISQTAYNDTTISRVKKAKEEGDLIEAALRKIGFEPKRVYDLSKADLEKTLEAFRQSLAEAGKDAVGFVYYTGHGIQHPKRPENFLLGVDTNLTSEADIETYGVSLTYQRDELGKVGAKGVFLVFDACRNVPPDDLKSVGTTPGYKPPTKGMMPLKAPVGMLVAYATEEGEFAREGVYAPILASELVKPNQKIETVFTNTKDRVAQESEADQLPWHDPKVYGLCLTCPPGGGGSR